MAAIGDKEALHISCLWIFFILNLMKYFLSYAPLYQYYLHCTRCTHVLASQWAATLLIFIKYIPELNALCRKKVVGVILFYEIILHS